MPFTVRYSCSGRLGNCVYPYTLCVIYQLMGYIYIDTPQPNEIYIDDNTFLRLFNEDTFKLENIPIFESNIVFSGYFQHNYILKYYKKSILEFIKQNPNQKIHTCNMNGDTFKSEILFKDYLPLLELTDEDLVVHFRLEDRVLDIITPFNADFVISPHDYDKLLLNNRYKNIYWVMCKPKHDIEYRYIQYMINKWGGIYKEQTIEEDICLMRKARNIICSRSTFSVVSSAYSVTEQNAFMLNVSESDKYPHETTTNLHDNTHVYEYTKCNLSDLERILI